MANYFKAHGPHCPSSFPAIFLSLIVLASNVFLFMNIKAGFYLCFGFSAVFLGPGDE